MIDGLWTSVAQSNVSNIHQRSAVLVFREGKIFGGNSISYLQGDYALQGSQVTGEFVGTHYYGEPITLFGLVEPGESNRMRFTATVAGDLMHGEGYLVDHPKLRVKFTLTRRAEL